MDYQSFKADDGREIYYLEYSDLDKAKAIINLIHGMSDHIARYDDFANFLVSKGYLVYGMDYRGHGKTGQVMGRLGSYYGQDGFDQIIRDMLVLAELEKDSFPGLKIFNIGHSMGSFIARKLMFTKPDLFEGMALLGTASCEDTMDKRMGYYLGQIIHFNKTVEVLFPLALKYLNKEIENPLTDYDWVSSDRAYIRDFVKDPLTGFAPDLKSCWNCWILWKA